MRTVEERRIKAEYMRGWNARNREKVLAGKKRSYEKNKVSILAKMRSNKVAIYAGEKRRMENKEYAQAKVIRKAAYRKANADKIYADNRMRKKLYMRSKAAWANWFFVTEIYNLARIRTRATGVKFEVDHIIPLRSPLVCGLHVESNLQVIPAWANNSKGNKFDPLTFE